MRCAVSVRLPILQIRNLSKIDYATIRCTDSVTSLPNRALFLDRMNRVIQSPKGDGNTVVSLVLFDLDRFRAVNESLGHAVGDMLLAAIARRVELLV